jgi:hypothetical protein
LRKTKRRAWWAGTEVKLSDYKLINLLIYSIEADELLLLINYLRQFIIIFYIHLL